MTNNLNKKTYIILGKAIEILEEYISDFKIENLGNIKELTAIIGRLVSYNIQLKRAKDISNEDNNQLSTEKDLEIIKNYLEIEWVKRGK